MVVLNGDLSVRLLRVLHYGFLEARLLAQAKKDEQLVELADCMEFVSNHACDATREVIEDMHTSLRQYQEKYPPPLFDYLALLTGAEPVSAGVHESGDVH